MLKEGFIQKNVELYLAKMEQKHQQHADKITTLQNVLHSSAAVIQRCIRAYFLKKKTRAAIKIQRFYRKMLKRKYEIQKKFLRFKRMYASYKIYYFLKKKCLKTSQKLQDPKSQKPLKVKAFQRGLHIKIVKCCQQYLIIISALQSELDYIHKYMAYDRQSFHQEWQVYEKKEREWMWSQIKKKWVQKKGQIWINDNQKQVNAQKYVNNLIEQGYQKHHQKYQQSQYRLNQKCVSLSAQLQNITRQYLLSILFG